MGKNEVQSICVVLYCIYVLFCVYMLKFKLWRGVNLIDVYVQMFKGDRFKFRLYVLVLLYIIYYCMYMYEIFINLVDI